MCLSVQPGECSSSLVELRKRSAAQLECSQSRGRQMLWGCLCGCAVHQRTQQHSQQQCVRHTCPTALRSETSAAVSAVQWQAQLRPILWCFFSVTDASWWSSGCELPTRLPSSFLVGSQLSTWLVLVACIWDPFEACPVSQLRFAMHIHPCQHCWGVSALQLLLRTPTVMQAACMLEKEAAVAAATVTHLSV